MRRILEDWQDGLLRWPDAVTALGLAGLPQLYVAAYRLGVPLRRRLVDEAALPTIAYGGRLTTAIWRRNTAWQTFWVHQWDQRGREQGWNAGEPLWRANALERGRSLLSVSELHEDWRRRDLIETRRQARAFSSRIARDRDVLDGRLQAAIGHEAAVLWLAFHADRQPAPRGHDGVAVLVPADARKDLDVSGYMAIEDDPAVEIVLNPSRDYLYARRRDEAGVFQHETYRLRTWAPR